MVTLKSYHGPSYHNICFSSLANILTMVTSNPSMAMTLIFMLLTLISLLNTRLVSPNACQTFSQGYSPFSYSIVPNFTPYSIYTHVSLCLSFMHHQHQIPQLEVCNYLCLHPIQMTTSYIRRIS